MPERAQAAAARPVPGRAGGEVLALADANMAEMYRLDARATREGFVVERAGLVMCGAPTNGPVTNMAMVTGAEDAGTVAAETARVFGAAGLTFSVWTREHADAALEAELGGAGWMLLMRVPAMVFHDGDGPPVAPPRGVVIRRVATEIDRAAYAELAGEAWAVYGVPPASSVAHFADPAHLCGPTTAAFLAWEGDAALAGAVLYESHGVGGIGWVSTRSAARGRGLGAAITWAAVHEGLRRGARFASLQASPMGEPVYRRMGFTTASRYGVFLPRG